MRSLRNAMTARRHFRPKLPARGACDDADDIDSRFPPNRIAVTPTVAVAYGIVAVFLYALSCYPALAPALTGPGEIMAATPAE
jgi:hypothetical protein